MSTCFVIQPFDAGRFDKRFCDVFSPAIRDADLDPYRVDLDPTTVVAIDAIEQGIRTSAICLADITTDNPNVWFELGFAIACGKSVVMVCSNERETKFPFDVQHRSIITYKTEAPSDFEDLRKKITGKLKALITKDHSLRTLASESEVAPVQGLTQQEMIVLTCIAGNLNTPHDHVSAWYLRKEVEAQGFTKMASILGIKSLTMKGFVDFNTYQDDHGEDYIAYSLTEKGWQWIMDNQDRFLIQKPSSDVPF